MQNNTNRNQSMKMGARTLKAIDFLGSVADGILHKIPVYRLREE